jgi:hypothetical protein
MLQRLALAAALDELAKAVNLCWREHALKLEVQPHARLPKQVRQQQFRLQTGRLYPLLGQELRAALNGFKNRHTDKGTRSARRSKPRSANIRLP